MRFSNKVFFTISIFLSEVDFFSDKPFNFTIELLKYHNLI